MKSTIESQLAKADDILFRSSQQQGLLGEPRCFLYGYLFRCVEFAF